MKKILFWLGYPFLMAYSSLPLWWHYGVSDWLLYPLLFKVVGYRKKVVLDNLQRSFPQDSPQEIHQRASDFYHYLSDLMVETVKGFTISIDELRHRVSFDPFPALDRWYAEGKSAVMTLGHYGNYEWICIRLPEIMAHEPWVPYRKLTNPFFDRLFTKSRGKLGTVMFPTFETYKRLKRGSAKPLVIGLANDQASPPEKSYWTTFLHQDTSFFWGTERIAKTYQWPVFYMRIQQAKRGYYHVSWEVLCEDPKEMDKGVILEKHARYLEEDIRRDSKYWLWSHRRWKHAKPVSAT